MAEAFSDLVRDPSQGFFAKLPQQINLQIESFFHRRVFAVTRAH
jgi:hypothetical protein